MARLHGEEARGRQLSWVTNDHYLLATDHCSERIFRGQLRCFVEDDEVELALLGIESLRHGHRAHQEAGLERLDRAAGALQELPQRLVPALPGELVAEEPDLVVERLLLK